MHHISLGPVPQPTATNPITEVETREGTAMGQDRQQMDEEIEGIRKARNDLDEQLVNKMGIRAAKIQEEETKANMKKEKHTESSPRGGG